MNQAKRIGPFGVLGIFCLLGLGLLASVFSLFHFRSDFFPNTSSTISDWGAFGNYFGGVAGPLLTLISTLVIVYTVMQQGFQIETSIKESLKNDILRFILKIDDEISHLLTREIEIENIRRVEFGDLVSGIKQSNDFSVLPYKAAMKKLLIFTANYCQAISQYRDNVNGHFIFKEYQQRAVELVAYLEKNKEYLDQMAGITLTFCKMHLEGRSKQIQQFRICST
jgi:hypothetical protein